MATPTTETTLSKGVKVLKNLVFQFTKYDSTDIIERKTKFNLIARNGILGENGVPETVSYSKLITPIISEVQKLKAENDDLKAQLASVLARLDVLEAV